MKLIKNIATKSMIIEWLVVTFVIFSFDFIFLMKYGFDISLEHWIIALFNVMLVVSIIAFIRNYKRRYIAYLIFILVMFTFFITDSTLYRFKEDVTSIAMLLESGKNTMKIGIKYNPLKAYSAFTWLLITSFVVVMSIVLRRFVKLQGANRSKKILPRFLFLGLSITGLMVAPKIIDTTDQIIFDTPSDKALFVQKFGSITYHAKDIFTYTSNAIKPLFLKDDYVVDINDEVTDEFAGKSSLYGVLEGKNLIMIMCETCEEYGFTPEYTPNYYRLRNQSMYFTNFFSAAKSNYTYDAEFKSLTSMMYFQGDNFMYTYGENAYPTALPNMFKNEGYTARSFHDYYSDFFNRDEMHLSLGFESYFGVEELEVEENDFWPLDSLMFDQFKDEIIPIQQDPFYSFVITVTPHGPHDKYRSELEKYYTILEKDPKYKDESLEFKTITAAQMNFDEGLGVLLDDLEEKGLMDETVIVMYSDHKNYSSQPITHDKTPNSDIPYEIEKVPFLIYAPGLSIGENKTLSSHYDIAPTLLDLFGITSYKDFYYGQSLFLLEREAKPIILSYSSWIDLNYRVQFDEVVYGEVDEDEYLETKTEVYNTIQFYEKIFFSDYFRTENPFYLIDMIPSENE